MYLAFPTGERELIIGYAYIPAYKAFTVRTQRSHDTGYYEYPMAETHGPELTAYLDTTQHKIIHEAKIKYYQEKPAG